MPSELRTRHQLYHAEALAPLAATKLLVSAIGAIYALQIVLAGVGLLDVAAAMIADVAVLAGLVVYARARGLRSVHFGLRSPAGVHVAAAVLIGISAWYVNLYIVVLLEPPGDMTDLQTIVEQTPFAATIVAFAVLPAIVEEIVFRGVFARALTMRFVPAAAIMLSAAAFGAFHLLPPQMLSTFLLGLALAYLTLRAESAIPAMLAHLLNNIIALVVAREEIPAIGPWIAAHSVVALSIACTLTTVGLALAARGRR